jgi:hypothetical protein
MIKRQRAIIDALERAEIAVGPDDCGAEHISRALNCVATASGPADPRLVAAIDHLDVFLRVTDTEEHAGRVEDALATIEATRTLEGRA